MNARLMSSTEGLEQRTAPNSSPPAPAETELPLDGERLDLIRRFQREALARPNPLAANLAMINSDLMKLCQRLSKSMEKSVAKLGSSAGEHEQLARQTMTTWPWCAKSTGLRISIWRSARSAHQKRNSMP